MGDRPKREDASSLAAPLRIGDAVEVYSFGVHGGVITGFNPTVTIQGRTWPRIGWVRVNLQDGRTWHGTIADVAHVEAGLPPF